MKLYRLLFFIFIALTITLPTTAGADMAEEYKEHKRGIQLARERGDDYVDDYRRASADTSKEILCGYLSKARHAYVKGYKQADEAKELADDLCRSKRYWIDSYEKSVDYLNEQQKRLMYQFNATNEYVEFSECRDDGLRSEDYPAPGAFKGIRTIRKCYGEVQ